MNTGNAPAIALLAALAVAGCAARDPEAESVAAARAEAERQSAVAAAEAAYNARLRDYQRMIARLPNARCPRCGHPLRIRDDQVKRTVQCRRCLAFFGGGRARAHRTPVPVPPPPAPPSPPAPAGKGGFFGGFFG